MPDSTPDQPSGGQLAVPPAPAQTPQDSPVDSIPAESTATIPAGPPPAPVADSISKPAAATSPSAVDTVSPPPPPVDPPKPANPPAEMPTPENDSLKAEDTADSSPATTETASSSSTPKTTTDADQPAEEKPKSGKPWLWIIMLILLVAGIAIVGYALMQSQDGLTGSSGFTQTSSPTIATTQTYTDANLGYSVQYPSTWERSGLDGGSVLFLSPLDNTGDTFRENVGIVVESLPEGTSDVATYTTTTIEKLKTQIAGYTEESAGEVTINGQPGYRSIYSGQVAEGPVKWQQTWFVSGTRAYVLTYSSTPEGYNSHVSDAEAIINSMSVQ